MICSYQKAAITTKECVSIMSGHSETLATWGGGGGGGGVLSTLMQELSVVVPTCNICELSASELAQLALKFQASESGGHLPESVQCMCNQVWMIWKRFKSSNRG